LKEIFNKPNISSEELIDLLKAREKGLVDFKLIDIREPFEHQMLRIKGTDELIPITNFQKNINKWKKLLDENIIIYCRSGNRTSQLQNFIKQNFNKTVPHLENGIIEYSGETQQG